MRCTNCAGQLDTAYICMSCGQDNTPQNTSWQSGGTQPMPRCECGAEKEAAYHKFCPYCGKKFIT